MNVRTEEKSGDGEQQNCEAESAVKRAAGEEGNKEADNVDEEE